MKKFFVFIFFINLILISKFVYPQIEYEKWNKKEISYLKNDLLENRKISLSNKNIVNVLTKSIINIYWVFISDVDGDNCSFQPSCSSFFVEALAHTNFFESTLLFADRFTRDSNIFDKNKKYILTKYNKLYDPIDNNINFDSSLKVHSNNYSFSE
ncbi:MAG: hypothetical protein STSR0008_11570 [Ignavibacterium sp.]